MSFCAVSHQFYFFLMLCVYFTCSAKISYSILVVFCDTYFDDHLYYALRLQSHIGTEHVCVTFASKVNSVLQLAALALPL